VVADLLEGQAFGEQTDCAGVTQRMPAAMGRFNPERDEAPIGDVKDAACPQRPKRCVHAKEYFQAG
jgi:hypothetical protein